MLTALEVLGALLLLVVASDAFTNAVEWVGSLFSLTRSAVGAVVAGVGSSLPETMIAVVALLYLRDPVSQAIGIGAVIGAPFMLSTVVLGLIGAIAVVRRGAGLRAVINARGDIVNFGLALFVLTFAFVIGASFAPTPLVRIVASICVLASYAAYLIYHFKHEGEESDASPPPLRIAPRTDRPAAPIVFAQLAVALAVTVAASRWFVTSAAAAATQLGVAPLLLSLFLSPIATELPEMLNVVIWMRRGQDELAIGNVLGAMLFQTSVASSIAMLATPWHVGADVYAAAAATAAAVIVLLASTLARRRIEALPLLWCGAFYAGFIIYVAAVAAHR
ncbi:MAG TPA: hypothetical protein VEJ20_01645 [Candidatus Eremiobacteraceae bacterium]|nr:hypothetical protein [Candidatus Eremiobacteraceae bacterium]